MTVDTMAPAPFVEAPEVAESGGSRRTVLVAGGVAAALALGAAGYFLLSGGSNSTDLGAPASLPRAVQPAVKAPVKPAAKKPVVKVPAVSTVPLGRDPFKALYLLPVVSATTSNVAPSTVTPPTTSGGTTTPVQPAQPTSTAPKVYKLVLSRVDDGKVAVFSVGGKTMLAKVGSVFGPTGEIKLLSLGQDAKGVWTATIQVGDSEPVDASKGETLYVR
jgi:hypothetical protein